MHLNLGSLKLYKTFVNYTKRTLHARKKIIFMIKYNYKK